MHLIKLFTKHKQTTKKTQKLFFTHFKLDGFGVWFYLYTTHTLVYDMNEWMDMVMAREQRTQKKQFF